MLGQSGPRSNGNEGVLCIPQRPNITGTSPSDSLVSYPGHSLGVGSYCSPEKQLVYSSAPADWVGLIDETLINTTTLGQSGPGSNGNEGVLYISQSTRTGVRHKMWFSVIPRTHSGKNSRNVKTLMKRNSHSSRMVLLLMLPMLPYEKFGEHLISCKTQME